MIDASNYNTIETLKNGTPVRFRAIRADDKDRITEAFRNLEPESIYTRFFQHKKALTETELKAITEVDFDSVVALVVTVGEGENETIIAAGRYAAFDTANNIRSAEVSFTVEEDYHGQGLASRLLGHLTRIGREKGVAQFEAHMLPKNKAMLTVFARSGLPMQKTSEEGMVHVTLSLAESVA
ncbi:MAG TPA: GNAT family N-acetyltransferase [Desulfobacterales bacterium]